MYVLQQVTDTRKKMVKKCPRKSNQNQLNEPSIQITRQCLI